MSSYRITEFMTNDMAKTIEFSETLREEVSAAGAEFIHVIDAGGGKGIVIAKYADSAAMDAASDINKSAFGKMVAAGLVDPASISGQSGDVNFTF